MDENEVKSPLIILKHLLLKLHFSTENSTSGVKLPNYNFYVKMGMSFMQALTQNKNKHL